MSIAPKKEARQSGLLQALAGEVTARAPFWLMRQAGRYLPEYRQLRQTAGSFMDLCFNPEFATEVTLQPLRRFDMDAAILFSDILVVPHALGQKLDFVEGEGPRLAPFTGAEYFEKKNLEAFDAVLRPVYETVRRVRAQLNDAKALIGFAGAPWTVACYMIQGHGGNEFATTKKYAFSQPEEFDRLIGALVTATAHYLIQQIRNGADVVQIFDSWAGLLPDPYFERWVTEPTRKIVERVNKACPGVPVIGFPRGAGTRCRAYAEQAGVQGLSLDQGHALKDAARDFGGRVTLQGNLDPALLLTGGKALEDGVRYVLNAARDVPFIFNLGHGIIKETPPEHVGQLADIIRAYQR